MKQTLFLRGEFGFHEAESKTSAFSRWLKEYKRGNLKVDDIFPTQAKRQRTVLYGDVERKLIEYIELRAKIFMLSKEKEQKLGLGYIILKEKAVQFAKQCGYTDATKTSCQSVSQCLH